jgi:hypothetical protein
VVYPISRYPVGGNGASPDRSIEAAWDGEALVIPSFLAWQAQADQASNTTVTFSLQDSHLAMKLDWQVRASGKGNTLTQLFDRAK